MKIFIVFILIFSASNRVLGKSMKQMAKADYLKMLSTNIPRTFCSPKEFFRQCYTVSTKACQKEVQSDIDGCIALAQADVPVIMRAPDDFKKWSPIISACASKAYQKSFVKKKISNEKCNDGFKW